MSNLILFFIIFFLLRVTIFTSALQKYFLQTMGQIFLAQSLFFLFFTFIVLNYLLCMYQNASFFVIDHLPTLVCALEEKLVNSNALSLNIIDVYLYPFIYVFSLITVLSIVFCLSYNKDESFSFMFYCQVILFAGYLLFFTNSLIIFFLLTKCYLYRVFLFYTSLPRLGGV